MLTAGPLAAATWIKSFPVQDDDHYYTVCRYVERNALRAGLAAWPLPQGPGWIEHVNEPQTDAELAALRRCLQRGCPFGEEAWCDRMVRRLGLESTLRSRGRPKRRKNGS